MSRIIEGTHELQFDLTKSYVECDACGYETQIPAGIDEGDQVECDACEVTIEIIDTVEHKF